MSGPKKRPSRRRPSVSHDTHPGLRLHKAMAQAGVGSRRACEKLIEAGRVSVNGSVIQRMPVWVDPAGDRVEVDGRPIRGRRSSAKTYLLVHKPRGIICTNADPQGRRRIIDLVPPTVRLFCVGRLDAESTGLVLLTDDGELANRLTHPRYGVSKRYQVSVRGRLDDQQLEKLR